MKVNHLLLVSAFLAGCAHLSEEQCRTMDWYQEGHRDALNGKLHRNLDKAQKDCHRFGLEINRNQYFSGYLAGARQYCTPDYATGVELGKAGLALQAIEKRKPVCDLANIPLKTHLYNPGWQAGIATFCTAANGFNLAREGNDFPAVCPATLAGAFEAGFKSGQDQFCNQVHNAFALGRENATYPQLCDRRIYPAFHSEYSRGAFVTRRSKELAEKLSRLNSDIDQLAQNWQLVQNNAGYYDLSTHTAADAVRAQARINALVNEKKEVDRELFQVNAMH